MTLDAITESDPDPMKLDSVVKLMENYVTEQTAKLERTLVPTPYVEFARTIIRRAGLDHPSHSLLGPFPRAGHIFYLESRYGKRSPSKTKNP